MLSLSDKSVFGVARLGVKSNVKMVNHSVDLAVHGEDRLGQDGRAMLDFVTKFPTHGFHGRLVGDLDVEVVTRR